MPATGEPGGTRNRRARAAQQRYGELAAAAAALGSGAADAGPEGPLSAAVADLSDRCLARLDTVAPADGVHLAAVVADLQELFTALRTQELADRDVRLAQCERGLGRLRGCRSTAELVDRVCHEVARSCGLSRVLLSRVERGWWDPWVIGGEDVDDLWRALPELTLLPLAPSSVEGRLIDEQRSALVPDTTQPGVHPSFRHAGSPAYVVAPIGPAGRVIGFLHGDHGPAGRACDSTDRDVLGRFAQGFGHLYERTALLESMRVQQQHLRDLLALLGATTERLTESEIELTAALGADPVPPLVPADRSTDSRLATLTRRERQVLELVAGGARNGEIAERLVLSEGTVKTHVKHILAKLGVVNRSQAITQYLGRGVS